MAPQVEMLRACMEIIRQDKLNNKEDQPVFPQTLYVQLLDWIATHLSFEGQIVSPPFQMATHDALRATFDLALLQEEKWDWFGELAVEMNLGLPGTELDRETVRLFVRMFEEQHGTLEEEIQDPIVLDPSVGTGRVVLAHQDRYGEKLIFFGTEKDKLSYRTALLNCSIYKIHSFLLHADPQKHDLGPQSKNWLAANAWHPLKENDLLETS